jgi:hypothetical protein
MIGTEPPAANLEDRISEARNRLQRTPECHPEFERRLLKLIHLVDERDARLAAAWSRHCQRLAQRQLASPSRRPATNAPFM